MRRLLLGGTILGLCVLPFLLGHVEARGRVAADGAEGSQQHKVTTLLRGVDVSGLTSDAKGALYFTAGDRVYRVTRDLKIGADGRSAGGTFEAVAGDGQRGYLGDGGLAAYAELNVGAVSGNLSADPVGNLFIADTFNETLRRVDAESQLISSIGARSEENSTDATTATAARPELVAADAAGEVFIADGTRLSRLDLASGRVAPQLAILSPMAVAVSHDGARVAVANGAGSMLLILDRDQTSPSITRIHTRDSQDSETAGSLSLIARATGLAFDVEGNLFIAEGAANLIERLDRKMTAISVFAGNGHPGYSGDGGPALAAEFNAPGALAIDRDGNLLIADTGNHAIRTISHAAAVAGVTLSPNTFTFANEPTGGASAAQPFTLTNNSSDEVTGIAIDFTGGAMPADFTQTSTCATTLAAGASCTINVVFMPQAAGQRSAALHVTDSDPSSPQTAALSGFADDYELGLQSGNTDTLTVVAGGVANFNLAVVPDANFSGTVTIECPVGLPSDTSCAVAAGTAANPTGPPGSPGSTGPSSLAIAVTPGTAQNFIVSLTTLAKGQTTAFVAPNGNAVGGGNGRRFPALPAAIFLAFGIFGWLGSRLRNLMLGEKRPRIKARSFMAFALGAAFLIFGCGGSSTPVLKTKPGAGTPAGTYHLDVRGDSQGATRASTITLIVQT